MVIPAVAYGAYKLGKTFLDKGGGKLIGKGLRWGAKVIGQKDLANAVGGFAKNIGDMTGIKAISDIGKGLSSKKDKYKKKEGESNDESSNGSSSKQDNSASGPVNYYKPSGVNSAAKTRFDSFFE